VEGLLRSIKQGVPLRQNDLERAMLLLADTPGITAQASLESGVEPGTTDLIIEINKDRRWRASIYADNWGTYYTGYYRLGGTFRWLSPLGLGDELDISPLITSEEEVLFGALNYELPVGNSEMRGSVSVSRLNYQLGQELEALGGAGYAETLSLGLAYPVIRSRTENLFLRLSYSYVKLQDRYDAVGFEVNKQVDGLAANATYEKRDSILGGGYNSASATLFGGNLDIQSPDALALDQSPFGLDTQGDFVKLNLVLSRLQALRGPITAYFGAFGQVPNKNLDSSQRIALGGPTAVRAYPASEGVVDQGAVATVELRWGATQDLTLSAFYDAGWGDIVKSPPAGFAGDKSVTLRGYGLGLTWFRAGLVSVRLSVAWRDTGPPISDPDASDPLVFVQVVGSF
jgi:hemolysin activation/secretion protein